MSVVTQKWVTLEMSVGREIYPKFIEKFSVELPDADRFCYFFKLFFNNKSLDQVISYSFWLKILRGVGFVGRGSVIMGDP